MNIVTTANTPDVFGRGRMTHCGSTLCLLGTHWPETGCTRILGLRSSVRSATGPGRARSSRPGQ